MQVLLKNKPMIATLVSGILILLGIALEYARFSFSPFIFGLSSVIGGYHQAKLGFRDTFKNRHLNVDLLMVLAAVGASLIGYWLEGALLTFIFSLSGSMEEYAINKSSEAITALMKIVPPEAKRQKADGSLETVPVERLAVGDFVVVPKGESIPIDGRIVTGIGQIDESSITGESFPVEKRLGEDVYGGTLNLGEALTVEVSKEAKDTLFAKIIRLVKEAQSTPSKTASFINRIENTYVKVVLLFVPIMIAVFYFLLGWTWNESFYRGMVLLTVASPCALVASATPTTLSAISNAAKRGILFKGGVAAENFSQLDCIAFDKTGTLTQGKPTVTDSSYSDPTLKERVLGVVASLEHTSTHPIAQALMLHLQDLERQTVLLDQVEDLTGYGIRGMSGGSTWKIGKASFVVQPANQESPLVQQAEALMKQGKTLIYVSRDDQVVAYYALLDTPKQEAYEVVDYFNRQGCHTIMITGDNQATGETIGKEIGVKEIRANCLPEEKTLILQELKKKYEMVAMVGDGINDAPALANSDIGIAMGEGTDIAMETSDVVLMQDELSLLPYSYRLSQKLKRVTLQNIIFSLSIIVILIISNLFQVINLPLGVVGHEGSTILVILNGLRLLRVPYGRK